MHLKEMGRETIYLEEYVTVHSLLSCSSMSLHLYCSNKYNSICTHLIKHLIFLKNSTLKHLIKIKHAYIKINLPNSLLVWVQ